MRTSVQFFTTTGIFCLFTRDPQIGQRLGKVVTFLGPLGFISPGAEITSTSQGESSSISRQPHFSQDISKNFGFRFFVPNGNGIIRINVAVCENVDYKTWRIGEETSTIPINIWIDMRTRTDPMCRIHRGKDDRPKFVCGCPSCHGRYRAIAVSSDNRCRRNDCRGGWNYDLRRGYRCYHHRSRSNDGRRRNNYRRRYNDRSWGNDNGCRRRYRRTVVNRERIGSRLNHRCSAAYDRREGVCGPLNQSGCGGRRHANHCGCRVRENARLFDNYCLLCMNRCQGHEADNGENQFFHKTVSFPVENYTEALESFFILETISPASFFVDDQTYFSISDSQREVGESIPFFLNQSETAATSRLSDSI